MKTALKVGKIINIPIEIDVSWLIIFALIAVTLSEGYFPGIDPKISPLFRWITGVTAAIFLFASILIHELSHSYVAQKSNIVIKKITLFIFGGVAQLTREPEDPKTELKVAVAGPISSIILAGVFFTISMFFHSAGPYNNKIVFELFRYLFMINLILAVFNLIPAFPLDGGRIFRAFIWMFTNNMEKSTRIASYIGQAFAFFLMFVGLMQVFTGRMLGGLWLIFIGWFLNNAAMSSWQQVMLRYTIGARKVKDIMTTEVIKVTRDISIEDLIENYFLHYKHIVMPVTSADEVVGIITLHAAKAVPKDKRRNTPVSEVMKPIDEHLYLSPDTTVVEALNKMQMEEAGRLLVVENKKLAGILSKSDILKFIQIKMELE